MQSIARERLQEMLNWWKYLSLAREVTAIPGLYRGKVTDLHSYLGRWRNYEQMILDQRVRELDPKDWVEWRDPLLREVNDTSSIYFRYQMAQHFPLELFSWNRLSRRAFHIPEILQAVFMAGDYSRWKWEDILWPYESVVLTLEHPFEIETEPGRWIRCDTILFSRITISGSGFAYRIRMLRRPTNEPGSFPVNELRRVDKQIRRRNEKRVFEIVSRIEDVIYDSAADSVQGWYSGPVFATFPLENTPQLTDHIKIEPEDLKKTAVLVGGSDAERETRWTISVLSMAIKILIGWAAYMEQMQGNAYESMPSGEKGTRGITGIITSPEHICTMLLKGSLDPSRYVETKEREFSSGMFKRPHWRRGHKQRERGSPPTAPRTIRVPPMLIRADLVPIFGIISGTQTWIKDDDEF